MAEIDKRGTAVQLALKVFDKDKSGIKFIDLVRSLYLFLDERDPILDVSKGGSNVTPLNGLPECLGGSINR